MLIIMIIAIIIIMMIIMMIIIIIILISIMIMIIMIISCPGAALAEDVQRINTTDNTQIYTSHIPQRGVQ